MAVLASPDDSHSDHEQLSLFGTGTYAAPLRYVSCPKLGEAAHDEGHCWLCYGDRISQRGLLEAGIPLRLLSDEQVDGQLDLALHTLMGSERQTLEVLIERIARRVESRLPDAHVLILVPGGASGWGQVVPLDGSRRELAASNRLGSLTDELEEDLRLLRRVADDRLELSIEERRLTDSAGRVLAFSGGAWRPAA